MSTGGLREPLLCKITAVDRDQAAQHGFERAAVGIPSIDAESWDAARAWRAAADSGNSEPRRPALDIRRVMAVIAAFGGDGRLWTEHMLARLADRDPSYAGMTAEDLAGLLRPLGVRPRDIRHEGKGRKGCYRDEIAAALDAWKAGERP